MAKDRTRCVCSAYAVEIKDENGEVKRAALECDSDTASKFAPGHDARLKSLLVKAGAVGADVVKTIDDDTVRLTALDAASEFGFADAVARGIELLAAKIVARAERDAAKAEARQAKRVAPGPAKAKVGRKVYDGVVSEDGLTFEYTVAVGSGDDVTEETRATQKFRVVADAVDV